MTLAGVIGMARRPKLTQEMVDEAVAALGLDARFRARISPMELTYLPTGQRAVFRKADNPLKFKGVKLARDYAAVMWFEELDQSDGIGAVRHAMMDDVLRG